MSRFVRKAIVAMCVALGTIIITQDDILRLGILQRLELASLDYRFRYRGAHTEVGTTSDIVIVEVSEESLRSLPDQWPWPRSYYARLARNLKAAGAAVVGLDIILTGPDAYSSANDDELRNAIKETGIVVLAGKLDAEHSAYQVASERQTFSNQFYPIDRALGLVNIRNDPDGVYRRYSPYWEQVFTGADRNDTLRMPTFGFAVLNKYFHLPPGTTAENRQTTFEYALRSIPKYDASSFLTNYQGPSGTFRRVKFVDVIDDASFTTREEEESGQQINTFSDQQFGYLYDGTFKDKIVLVGSTNPEDHDLFPVSIAAGIHKGDNLMYGVEIHANVIETVLRGNFLTRQSGLLEILTIVLCVFITFFATSWLRSMRTGRHAGLELLSAGFAVLAIIGALAAALELFASYNYVTATVSPVVAILSGYFASTAFDFVTERKQRMLIKSMFSTYVNPVVVEELIANPSKLRLGGERKQLTVLFSDIEGFTTLSERMDPELLVSLLNEYLSAMAGIVFKHNGTLDKYEGDAVMAFWGAPVQDEQHALHACECALEMQNTLARIRAEWQRDGKPQFFARIGVNTGEMIVGNMGGEEKFDFTVIGDAVNIASRLEGANRYYKTEIIIGETTYEAVKDRLLCRELDLVTVRGRSVPLRTYELLGADHHGDHDTRQFVTLYQEGLRLFRSRHWSAAQQAFSEARKLRPADCATNLHLSRIEILKDLKLPEDWKGVFELTTK